MYCFFITVNFIHNKGRTKIETLVHLLIGFSREAIIYGKISQDFCLLVVNFSEFNCKTCRGLATDKQIRKSIIKRLFWCYKKANDNIAIPSLGKKVDTIILYPDTYDTESDVNFEEMMNKLNCE